MNTAKIEQYTTYGVFFYILLFTLYGFVARIIPVYMLVNEPINSYILILFAIVGCGLVASDLLKGRYMFKAYYCWILYAFIVIMAVSSLVNIQYGYIDNLKTIIWTVIQIVIFYSAYTRVSKEKIMKYVYAAFHLISWIWTAAIIYSLKQFVMMEAYGVEIRPDEWKRQGFRNNRLFGIFNDPNYAAVTSVYVIFMLLYIMQKTTKVWLRCLCVLACVAHGIYILLSGSRTAKICILLTVFIYVFLALKNRYLYIKNSIGILKRLVISTLIVGVIMLTGSVTEKIVVNVPMIYAEHIVTNAKNPVDFQNIDSTEEFEHQKAQRVLALEEQEILNRQDIGEGTSNRRLRTWKNYLEGVKGRYVIGASPRNVTQYMEDKHPEIYERNEGYETHNGFLSVFVGTGVVGLGIVVLFMILVGKRVCLYCFNKEPISKEFVTLFSIILVILIYTCFFTELFFVNNLTTAIFWTLLGCIMYWIGNDERKVHFETDRDHYHGGKTE